MTELADLFPSRSPDASRSAEIRAAIVTAVSGKMVTVDIGGPIVVRCVDSCIPVVGQTVLVGAVGTTRWALGVVDGTYRQSFIKVTANGSTTVTGILNGASTAVSKVGAFTATVGDTLLLVWAADGTYPFVVAPPGVPYIPPSGGGGGGGGGGGSPPPSGGGGGPYTSYYAATASGYKSAGEIYGNVVLGFPSTYGFYRYGYGRMRELIGKTLISGAINLPRVSGSGTATISVVSGLGSSAVTTGGWAALSGTRLSALVNSPSVSQTEVHLTGSGTLKGTPAGTIQITWS